jgi:peptidoglycan/LPS O-acetylase OafA/YrhL
MLPSGAIFGLVAVVEQQTIYFDAIACCMRHASWALAGLVSVVMVAFLRFSMCFIFGVFYRCYRDAIPWSAFGFVVALAFMMLGMCVYEIAEASVCLFGGYAMIWLAERAPVFHAFNKLPDVSYGVYLYAWPINKALLWFWPAISLGESMLMVLFAALAAGCLSWYLVEKPALRLK